MVIFTFYICQWWFCITVFFSSQKHALKDGPEHTSRDGQYNLGLHKASQIVEGSDRDDRNLCPKGVPIYKVSQQVNYQCSHAKIQHT